LPPNQVVPHDHQSEANTERTIAQVLGHIVDDPPKNGTTPKYQWARVGSEVGLVLTSASRRRQEESDRRGVPPRHAPRLRDGPPPSQTRFSRTSGMVRSVLS
jgi:hypothetical protein